MTTFSLTWLPEVLEAAGLQVAETPGWRSRGLGDMGRVRGVMCHHTANPQMSNMPTLNLLINGRRDLSGPLSQLGLGRDGTFYIIAAGRANHAGRGVWEGVASGNSSFIGIEAEHSGRPEDPWPEPQLEAYARGAAAICKHIGAGANMVCGHKEFATPHGRKPDPTFDMPKFRSTVAAYLAGKTPPPLIPAADGKQRPTLRRGMTGDAVRELQALLRMDPIGTFGPKTEAALREAQRQAGLRPDGICGPKSWGVLSGDAPPPAPAPAAPPAPPAAASAHGRTLGEAGIKLIKEYEGCATRQRDGTFTAYPDPGSRDGNPWTIGWGSTGPAIKRGTVWTQQQCDDAFDEHIQRYVRQVDAALGPARTTKNQFDAMVSFHYNTGAIGTATMTKRHKAGDFDGAKSAFGMWVKNDGKVMAGLVRRRAAEAALYDTPDD